MKGQITMKLKVLLAVVILLVSVVPVMAQSADDYIPVHTREELSVLLSRVKGYFSEHGSEVEAALNETENQVVTSALTRSWAVEQYEDASPQQIDDAYDALYNMFLFVGLITDPESSLETGLLFQYAAQLLDREYYDLLEASGEDPETIEFAEYLRGLAEALVEDPESFTAEEVEANVLEIYQETYMAAGLKAIAHTEALPTPEELYKKAENSVMMPNPVVEYDTPEPLNELIGMPMPDLSDEFSAKLGYYSIVAGVIAESEYEFPDGGKVLFRLCPEPDLDISGVYGAEFYEDREFYGTKTEIYKYQSMLIARGNVTPMDGRVRSFAVDAEGIDEARFYSIVRSFIENCLNRKAGD